MTTDARNADKFRGLSGLTKFSNQKGKPQNQTWNVFNPGALPGVFGSQRVVVRDSDAFKIIVLFVSH